MLALVTQTGGVPVRTESDAPTNSTMADEGLTLAVDSGGGRDVRRGEPADSVSAVRDESGDDVGALVFGVQPVPRFVRVPDAVRRDEPADGGVGIADGTRSGADVQQQRLPAQRDAAGLWACCASLYVSEDRRSASTIVHLPQARGTDEPRMATGSWRDLIADYPWPVARFIDGYHEAGGDPNYEPHLIEDVIPCEYGWEPYVPKNAYMSRAQFDPGSWESAGGGDPADDYIVGRNVANWIAMIDDPGSTSGWPVCWNVGGW